MAHEELTEAQLRDFALKGAQLELERIYTLFPELNPNGVKPAKLNGNGNVHHVEVAAAASPAKSPRRFMSAKAKRQISIRMRRYWAARRKANAQKN